MEKCILIDGNSILFRAYYAFQRNSLKTRSGMMTGAVFGFAKMLLKILREQKPDFAAVAFDAARETFRQKIYPEYKAHRKPTPPDLIEQMPVAREFVNILKLNMFENPEYEADDFLGTIASRVKNCVSVDIITGDRDLLQLIDDRVSVTLCVKGISETKTYDPALMKTEYGFLPSGIVEMKALWGDSSDNIPGVDGIGEKKALTLIQEHGTIETLYNSLDKISNVRMREMLANGRDSAFLSKRLATIETKVPMELNLESLRWRGFESIISGLLEFCRKYEFNSFGNELKKEFAEYLKSPEYTKVAESNIASSTAVNEKTSGYSLSDFMSSQTENSVQYSKVPGERLLISDIGELKSRLSSANEIISLDIETNGLDPFMNRIVGFSFAFSPEWSAYVPLRHSYIGLAQDDQIPARLAFEALNNALQGKVILGHNLKFDLSFLAREGVIHKGELYDTMLASYTSDSMRSSALKSLGRELLNLDTVEYNQVVSKGDFSFVPLDKAADYAGQDVIIPLLLKPLLDKVLAERSLERIFQEIEMPLLKILLEMETTGIRVDTDYLRNLSGEFADRLKVLENKIYSAAGVSFNIGSPKQLQEILFTKLGLKPTKKTKTGFSTDSEVLKELAAESPVCMDLLEYREISKLKSTYADSLIELAVNQNEIIHTSFNQTVTATGRLSSSNPNLQNIPVKSELGRKIRRAFVSPVEGNLLVSIDYSQIEIRLLAHFSGDISLIEAFHSNSDIHSLTASKLFGVPINEVDDSQRKVGKTVNFGIIYGISAHALSEDLHITRAVAQKYIDDFFAQYPAVMKYFEETVAAARKNGGVETLFGRFRAIPELQSKNKQIQASGERIARNTPLQGSAADLVKKAMIDSRKILTAGNLQTVPLIQIHDEIVFSAPENELESIKTLVRKAMENVVPLKVPLVCDVSAGANLADQKPLE
ncbi:MAG: DNA polymerase I [Candidatus Riflebacteria bacterium]|nr:DNA polymerase I [Candidatus Riflebacteria bacterium]